MSGASLQRLLDLLREGATVDSAAARLGLPPDLATSMVEELSSAGLLSITTVGGGCGTCTGTFAVTCAGCPLAPAVRPRG